MMLVLTSEMHFPQTTKDILTPTVKAWICIYFKILRITLGHLCSLVVCLYQNNFEDLGYWFFHV